MNHQRNVRILFAAVSLKATSFLSTARKGTAHLAISHLAISHLAISCLAISSQAPSLQSASFLSTSFVAASCLICLSNVPVFAQLKAIDPSTLQLDETPSANGAPGGGFNNTPIQGRPLGTTFQPMNQTPGAGAMQPDQGAGFGSTMSPQTDEPIVTAQDEDRVNNLEQKAFGCSYHEHEVPDRLDHLEKEVLGAPRQGTIQDRITKLEVAKLLGGTAFGASANTVSQKPQSKQPAGGNNNGNGWLTQPAGTAMQQPQQMQQTPSQSTWQTPPGSSDYPPMQMQQATLPPPRQMPPQQQQRQQAPPQQHQQAPPAQQRQQAQGLQNAQQRQQMPPKQQQQPQQQQQQQQQPPFPQQQQQQPFPQQQQQQPFPQQQQQQPFPQQQQQMPFPQQQQQMPSQQQFGQPPQNFGRPPVRQGGAAPMGLTADASLVANSLFYDTRSGDYLAAIRRFPGANGQAGQTYAHWRSFPVRVRMPKESPESWSRALKAVVAEWDQYVPVKLALPLEAAPVEVQWVNQLPPKTLAVTRLMIAHGEMRVIIYLLRPSFYPPEVPERSLAGIFMHEVGHALGLFGHSDKPTDLMYSADIPTTGKGKTAQVHFAPVSTRDINTLKKIYESPAVPPTISLEQPLEWSFEQGSGIQSEP